MRITRVLASLITAAAALLMSACSDIDPPADAPANVTATAGESLAVINWDVIAGRTYWIYFKQGSSVSLDDKDGILFRVNPPFIRSGLVNGTEYAYAVTSSQDGSAVGPFSAVVTSTPRLLSPAVSWYEGTSLTVHDLRSISFGAGTTYVIVGDAASLFIGTASYTADAGVIAWEAPTSIAVTGSTNLVSVIYDGVRFMALGDDGSITINSPTDSKVWIAATAISGAPSMHALTAGAGVYVAVGDNGAIYTNSTSGATEAWVDRSPAVTTNHLYNVTFVNGRFIAVGAAGTMITSSNGIDWTAVTSNTASTLRQSAFGASTYVAVGDAGAIVSSSDAITWTAQSLPTGESMRSIVYGPDAQFIAVGSAGVLAYSITGADGSWAISNAGAIDLNSIAPGAVFIAVGAAGANVSGK